MIPTIAWLLLAALLAAQEKHPARLSSWCFYGMGLTSFLGTILGSILLYTVFLWHG
jgi:hypothetical protein